MSYVESLEAHQVAMHKARTEHRCCECLGTIRPGERYHLHAGFFEGKAHTYKRCWDCEKLADDLVTAYDFRSDEFLEFGGLRDELMNCQDAHYTKIFNAICRKRGSAQRVIA